MFRKSILVLILLTLLSVPTLGQADGEVVVQVQAPKFLNGKWAYDLSRSEMCAGTQFCPSDLPLTVSGRYGIKLKYNARKFKLEGHLNGYSPLAKKTQKYKVVSKTFHSVGFQRKHAKVLAGGLCTVPTETIFLTVVSEARKLVEVHHRIQWILCGKANHIWDQADFRGEATKTR